MNDGGDYRTAPATPGLLKMIIKLLVWAANTDDHKFPKKKENQQKKTQICWPRLKDHWDINDKENCRETKSV